MPPGQVEEIIAVALVFVVHVVGAVALVWALLDGDQRDDWRRRWGGGGGGGGDDDPRPPEPPRGGDGARPPLPLPGAQPARARLREPRRPADRRTGPARRPAHPPQPPRTPAPGHRRTA